MMAQRALRELQLEAFPAHGVDPIDHPTVLNAQGLGQCCGIANGHECDLGYRRRPREAGVVIGQVDIPDPFIGGLDLVQALLGQFLDQTILQGPEHAFRAAPRLGRIGWNVLDSQAVERPADLCELALVDGLSAIRSRLGLGLGHGAERRAHSLTGDWWRVGTARRCRGRG